MSLKSWGNIKQYSGPLINPSRLNQAQGQVLATGKNRSYGDSCFLETGTLLNSNTNDYILSFDTHSGIIKCAGGVGFNDILRFCVPLGWFLPVTPGTKFVTVAGAVANDVHGKNHHRDGNIGHWVKSLGLIRSDDGKLECSPQKNSELFYATIAGLGLTGYIDWVELQLIPIQSAFVEVETIQFEGMAEFLSINRKSSDPKQDWPYTVAWCDFSNTKNALKGLYIRGRHSPVGELVAHSENTAITVPFDLPARTLNPMTIKAFNWLYYGKNQWKNKRTIQHYDPFFYPLDSVLHWNRIYGADGFYQFQCVIPLERIEFEFLQIIDLIGESGQGSFLTVLKTFGDRPSLGMLSFPCKGITLCMDFANLGKSTWALMKHLEAIVTQAGGRLYPAKDALMSPESFKVYYPRYKEFLKYRDPKFNSDFWKRVGGDL